MMRVGDTVFYVNGVSPKVDQVHLDSLQDGWFTASGQLNGCYVQLNNWGQVFDNTVEADRAIIRNIDRAVADRQKQIDNLLADRATVMARLEP